MASHENHDSKMCAKACCPCNIDLDELKPLVNNPRFICASCGRVANQEQHLCNPQPLE